MQRQFLTDFRRFSTKKLGEILGKSSKVTPKSKNRSQNTDWQKILAPRLRAAPKTLKEAENAQNRPKLNAEESLMGAEIAGVVSKVGEILGDGEKVKSDLLKKLLEIDRETFQSSKPNGDFSSKLSNMTIKNEKDEKEDLAPLVDREKQFFQKIGLKFNVERRKSTEIGQKQESSGRYEFIDFLSGEKLNLFDEQEKRNLVEKKPQILNPIWEEWRLKHSKWLLNVQPRNGFEEMIEWTEKGRAYPYPIDNEFGFHEKLVPFQEHVFLHRTLDGDQRAPRQGPVRQFLDAVCTGLSKNPYMKLERKKEHLEWYLGYFQDKIHLIEKMKENEDQLTD